MGVDYSATSGYGFAIPVEDLVEVAERVGYVNPYADDYEDQDYVYIEEEDLGDFLTRNNSLAYDVVGNIMGGEDMYLVILASATAQTADWRYASGLTKFGEFKITERDERELAEVYDLVYGQGSRAKDGAYIGWMLAMTVS